MRGAGRALLVFAALMTISDVAEAKPCDRPKVIRGAAEDFAVGTAGMFAGTFLGSFASPLGAAIGRFVGPPVAIWTYHNSGHGSNSSDVQTQYSLYWRYGRSPYDFPDEY